MNSNEALKADCGDGGGERLIGLDLARFGRISRRLRDERGGFTSRKLKERVVNEVGN